MADTIELPAAPETERSTLHASTVEDEPSLIEMDQHAPVSSLNSANTTSSALMDPPGPSHEPNTADADSVSASSSAHTAAASSTAAAPVEATSNRPFNWRQPFSDEDALEVALQQSIQESIASASSNSNALWDASHAISSSAASSNPVSHEIDLTLEDDDSAMVDATSGSAPSSASPATASDPQLDPSSTSSIDASSANTAPAAAAAAPIHRKRKHRAPSPFDPDCYEFIDLSDPTKEYNPPPVIRRKVIAKPATPTTSEAASVAVAPPPVVEVEKIVEVERQLTCSICLEPLTDPVATTCGHIYHRECIQQAIEHKKSCPECRGKLTRASKLIRLYI